MHQHKPSVFELLNKSTIVHNVLFFLQRKIPDVVAPVRGFLELGSRRNQNTCGLLTFMAKGSVA